MATFSQLLTEYVARAGITDAELARSIGVRRQTIFRWKEGIVARPRHRDDVLRCAARLRLSPAETDALLLSAGFGPESPGETDRESAPEPGVDSPGVEQSEDDPATQPGDRPPPGPSAEDGAVPVSSVGPFGHRTRWIRGLILLLLIAGVGIWLVRGVRPAPDPPTPTAMPTRPPPPSPTIVRISAGPGETLLLVSPFRNYTNSVGYNVAGRIRDALEEQITLADLPDTQALVWPETVAHPISARTVLAQSDASMLIWGEYDSGRVRVQLTLPTEEAEWERLLDTPDDLSSTINVEVPKEVQGLALLTVGRLYRGHGRFADARAAFEQALALEPTQEDTQSTLLFYLGTVAEKGAEADLDAAIDYYTRAVGANPDLVTARYNRGRAYLNRYYFDGDEADLDRAIGDLSWVVERRATSADALINLAVAYYERGENGDHRDAVAALDRAVALNPDDYRPYYNRALVHIRSGDRPAWESDLARVQALNPGHANAENALCWAYALETEPQLALPHCDRAVAMEDGESSRDGRGVAYAQLGRYAEAAAEFEAYLAWLGTRPPAAYQLYRGSAVEQWIEQLQADINPFDPATLESLR